MPNVTESLCATDLHRLFTDACCAHTEGRLEEAREHYLLLLGYLPESPLLHYNIGLVYYTLRDFDLAVQAFTRALACNPGDTDTLFNLALSQKQSGACEAAIATYLQVLETSPDHVDCWYNLAGCYRDIHADGQAITSYLRVLAIDAAYLPAANNLAYLYHRTGQDEQAALYYRKVLDLRPADDSARYMLASLNGMPLDHAPDTYIRDFFDTYAEGFEHSLVTDLGYDTPRKLAACLGRCPGAQARFDHGLDLGCGTGLSGVSFAEVVATLDGVDLSRNMLARAAQKGCYHSLHADSISHHLQTTDQTYDLFLATDVFIYVGDLEQLFIAARDLARPSALFCFSTENLDTGGYQLRTTGRFAYSRAYIQTIAAATGWTVLEVEATRLRKERDTWLAGDLWILRCAPQEPA
jgi:predicted TPR repeat methyltransferase